MPVAELVDAVDLKSAIPEKNVKVQILLGTPNKFIKTSLDILVKIWYNNYVEYVPDNLNVRIAQQVRASGC